MNKRLPVLLAAIVASGVVFLDSSVVTLALPKIALDLHAGFAGMQWVVDGYLLSLSALILIGGSLGDIIGHKKVFLIGAAAFGVSSLLCGIAPSLSFLIAARILQGAAGALLVPQSLALINTNFPKEERGKAIGTWAGWSGISTAIAPLVGGYLLDTASWRWIFFINLPLLAVCLWLGIVGIREVRPRQTRRIDVGGALLAITALGSLTYGLIEGSARSWPPLAITALIAGSILGITFVWYEYRQRDPMVQLGLFRTRNFTGTNIMTFGMYGALGGVFLVLVVYLQTTLHYSSIKAGLSILPITILLLAFSRRAGALSSKFGPRLLLTAGPLIAALGIITWVRLAPGVSYITGVLPGVLLFGAGLTLLVAPLTTTVLGSVKETDSGIASGINNAVSRLGGLFVVALLGLFGAAQVFRFGIILCAALAAAAGIISYVVIRDPSPAKS
jgi:EmrB/QacA subfamily drug resistance transporter